MIFWCIYKNQQQTAFNNSINTGKIKFAPVTIFAVIFSFSEANEKYQTLCERCEVTAGTFPAVEQNDLASIWLIYLFQRTFHDKNECKFTI